MSLDKINSCKNDGLILNDNHHENKFVLIDQQNYNPVSISNGITDFF